MPNQNWDDYFMSMTYLLASRSKDQSTHVGAVVVTDDNIVKATGYNSFPRGINDNVPERQSRGGGVKYHFFEHAERNAIYAAAKEGISLKGCRMYTNGTPCSDCARAVIQAGIKEVIVDRAWETHGTTKWTESAAYSQQMFNEAGIPVRLIDVNILTIERQRDGKKY